jgi:hypothetical protein
MLGRRCGPRFVMKAPRRSVRARFVAKELESDVAALGQLERFPNHSHAARAEGSHEPKAVLHRQLTRRASRAASHDGPGRGDPFTTLESFGHC